MSVTGGCGRGRRRRVEDSSQQHCRLDARGEEARSGGGVAAQREGVFDALRARVEFGVLGGNLFDRPGPQSHELAEELRRGTQGRGKAGELHP